MEKETLIEKFKKLLFNNEEESTEETQFMEVKTQDGTILRVDVMEIGQSVMQISEEGESPAETGTYILEDGTTLIVADGVIESIEENLGNEEEEEMSEESEESKEAKEETQEENKEEKEVKEEEVDERAELLEEIAKIINSKFEAIEKEQDEKYNELVKKFEDFKAQPSEDETEKDQSVFKRDIKNKDLLSAFAKNRSKK